MNLSLGHLFTEMYDAKKGGQVTNSKKSLRFTYKYTVMQLSLNYEVFM